MEKLEALLGMFLSRLVSEDSQLLLNHEMASPMSGANQTINYGCQNGERAVTQIIENFFSKIGKQKACTQIVAVATIVMELIAGTLLYKRFAFIVATTTICCIRYLQENAQYHFVMFITR